MPKPRFPSLIAAVMACASAVAAEGTVPLAKEPHINEQLIAAAAGDVLRQTCPTISVRVLVVWGKKLDLENYTRSKGYSEAEVRTFLNDPVQKAQIRRMAEAYLAKAGVVKGNVESYCRVGRDEISRRTLVGSLLRSSQ